MLACTLLGGSGVAKGTATPLCKIICSEKEYDGFSHKPPYDISLKPGEAYIGTDGNPIDLPTLGATLGKVIGLTDTIGILSLKMQGRGMPASKKFALEDGDGRVCMIVTYDVILKV